MKRKIFGLLVILFVTIIPVTLVNAISINNSEDVDSALKEYLGENYEEKIRKNTKSVQNIEKIDLMFKKQKTKSSDVYPDYIGGFYIDKQDNNMVIQIVKENIPNILKSSEENNLYNEMLSIDEDAKIKYVNYSYNEINGVIKILEDYYSKNYENGYIDGYYDDVINNRVVVELKNYSEDEISNFKRDVLDSDLIYFTKSTNTIEYATYMPGEAILPLGCSVGFRARLNGVNGFVTAGHCTTGVNQVVGGFGVVKKRRYSGNVDASWIKLDASNSIGTGLKYHASNGVSLPLSNTPVTNFVVGQLYGKSGFASGYTYGNITSLSLSGANGITGLIGTGIYAKPGDSGGIVFKIGGTGTNPISYQTAGIVHGGPEGGGNLKFVKANSIISAFGLTVY